MSIQLRVASLADDLEAIIRFYRDGLSLEVIDSFTDHNGFDGVMLGHAGDWDVNGKAFEDPDGNRVVLQNAAWNSPVEPMSSTP